MNEDNDSTASSEATVLSYWRKGVDQDMEQLRERVLALELECHEYRRIFGPELVRNSTINRSFTTVAATKGVFYTLCRIITSRKFASLQCLWLLLCCFSFLYYASTQLIIAQQNERAEHKAEKIRYVADYGAEGSSLEYDMPYVYIFFWASYVGYDYDYDYDYYYDYNYDYHNSYDYDYDYYHPLPEEMINDTLAKLLESQQNFNDLVTIWYYKTDYKGVSNVTVVEEVVVGHVEETITNNGFDGYFRLKLPTPTAGLGMWETAIRVRCDSLTLNDSWSISNFFVKVDRQLNPGLYYQSGIFLNYQQYQHEDVWYLYNIGYKETVKHKLNGDVIHTIEDELIWDYNYLEYEGEYYDYYYDLTLNYNDTRGFMVRLAPDLKIEHWEEFVEYGVWDWIAAMGGVLSITSMVYFWVGYRIAKYSGSTSLGILPAMSFVFTNLEDIRYIKRQLQ